MPITPWLPSVKMLTNGESASAETLNPLFSQQTQRSQHLYEKFDDFTNKSTLIAFDIPILPSAVGTVENQSVVYYTKEVVGQTVTEGIDLAKTAFSNSVTTSAYTASNSSFAFGIVRDINVTNSTANVFLLGLVDLPVDIDDPSGGLMVSSEIDQAAPFEPGPLYLSRATEGKLTKNPGGVAIYIGYALNRRSIFLSPNVSEFNQFFTTYRFNILDRPVGYPTHNGSIWTISDVPTGLPQVGWVPIASLSPSLQLVAPAGAKFYYNLPHPDTINLDTGILLRERTEQKALAAALPPSPASLTWLLVNGVAQISKDTDPDDGIYVVNEYGIWWFTDAINKQPWAQDITASITFTRNANTLVMGGNTNFEINDVVYLDTTTTLPTSLPQVNTTTPYYIRTVTGAINTPQTITIATSVDPLVSPITFSNAGSGTHSIRQPYIWKFAKGSSNVRPRMLLHFIKFNPSLKTALVTSIKKYNQDSSALGFYLPDKSGESTAGTGDLLARLLLNFVAGTPLTSSATALAGVAYNETTGIITTTATPIVSELIQGTGVTIAQKVEEGIVKPGSYIISAGTGGLFGKVTSIEPDGAELLYTGLHSYLNMPIPSVRPSSFIGKILLDANIPNADLTLILLLIGSTTSSNPNISFDFSYSVSTPGSQLTSSVTTVPITFAVPVPYTAKTCFKIGNVVASAFSVPVADLKIPASAFLNGEVSVNFKLARTTPLSNHYAYDIGIVDIYYKIG